MNNSKLAIDSVPLQLEVPVVNKTRLREREGELLDIISSLQTVQQSKEWSSLKTHVFDGHADRLSKNLLAEAKKDTPDTLKLARVSGELKWAERFSNLFKLEEEFRLELAQIRLKLHGTTEETG